MQRLLISDIKRDAEQVNEKGSLEVSQSWRICLLNISFGTLFF